MTIASQLPKTILDSRGDRLRFELANALNEVEAQYRRGGTDKAASLASLLTAVQTKLSGLTSIGALTLSNVSSDNSISAAEAGSNIPVTGTTVNCNGQTATLYVDGVSRGTSTVSGNSYSISYSSANATALSIGSHTFEVRVVDNAGIQRKASRAVSRTA